MYIKKDDHPKCFVPGCKRPRKFNPKGKHKGKHSQTCRQCSTSSKKRQQASLYNRKFALARDGQGGGVKPGCHSTVKTDDSVACGVYEASSYLLSKGLGTHDELVGETFGVSKHTAMRIRLNPEKWNIPLPPLKGSAGRPRQLTARERAIVNHYLTETKAALAGRPVEPNLSKPDRVANEPADSDADIDAALEVIAQAIKSRDLRIDDLETENDLLRENQVNQVYTRMADLLLKRFASQLRDKEGEALRGTLKSLMRQKPGAGE